MNQTSLSDCRRARWVKWKHPWPLNFEAVALGWPIQEGTAGSDEAAGLHVQCTGTRRSEHIASQET